MFGIPGFFFVLLMSLLALEAGAVERSQVEGLLQGYEWEVDADAFARLGAGTDRVLLAIATDDAESPLIQSRARTALGLYPVPAVWDFFKAEILQAQGAVARRQGVEILCKAFSGTRLADIEPLLAPLLQSEEVHLRAGVARCLSQAGVSSQTRAAVERYRMSITEIWEARAAGLPKE